MGRKRNPWVRLYTKILQSADYMEAPYHVRVAWIALICYASDCNDGGRLISGTKPLDSARLARLANILLSQADDAIIYFLDCGMLTLDGDVLCVANWDEYQKPSDNSSYRVKKSRDNCNGDNAVTVTVQEEEVEIDEEAKRVAEILHSMIQVNMEDAGYNKSYPINAGSVAEIERLHRLDGVEYQTIEQVVVWCQKDEFWKMNILSGSKLRKQFPRLLMQMHSETQKKEEKIDVPRFV